MPETKILMGFLSAHHPSRWHRRQIARCQFLKDSPLDHVFVFGRPGYIEEAEQYHDCLMVDCDDRKEFMPYKNQALFRYALDRGYTHVLRCCDDTWVYPDRVLKAGLEAFDLAGHFPCKFKLGGTFSMPFLRMNYPHGGVGIWLSQKAMEMLVADEWDEHYLDPWPKKMNVGFGLQFPRPPHYWDDHWIGEVLQGKLAYDDPLREQPWEAYTRNGISVYEDAMLFLNDEPQRPLTIHDPGVHKPNDSTMDELMEQIRKQNVTAAQAGQAAMPIRVEAGPPPAEEVPNAY